MYDLHQKFDSLFDCHELVICNLNGLYIYWIFRVKVKSRMFIIEFFIQHGFGCTCVKQSITNVFSTKYPYVAALPSNGNIPTSNHVLVDCDFASSWDHKYVVDISTWGSKYTIGYIIQCLFCFPFFKVVPLWRGVSYAHGYVLHNIT